MVEPLYDVWLEAQEGVATRTQLEGVGFTRGEVRAHIEGGRWRELNDHVLVMHNGPLTWRQQMWAAYLSAPGPVALCGLTSMWQWDIRGFEKAEVHLLVPRGARPLAAAGVSIVVHESRRFSAADIVHGRTPPTTTLSRATVDAAASTWSEHVEPPGDTRGASPHFTR